MKRVHGETWAERCQDAERLAKLSGRQQNPNAGELAALAAYRQKQAGFNPLGKDAES